MARVTHHPRPVIGLVLALICLLAPGPARPAAIPDVAAASLPAWHGGIDLYRKGTFTTQKSWLWCTAADVQIMRNITRGERDHSKSGQQLFFNWMRDHNRYSLPLSAGVDPPVGLPACATSSMIATGSSPAAHSPLRSSRPSRTCGGRTCRSGSRSPAATTPGS